jgi:hypothetical protein
LTILAEALTANSHTLSLSEDFLEGSLSQYSHDLRPVPHRLRLINSITNNRNRRSYMVWKISKKKEVTEKEIQQTALYGLLMIVPLALLAWAIEHLQYIG